LQPLRDGTENEVADLVTEAVVDDLERVNVDRHDRHRGGGSLRAPERLRGPVAEQRPVRQAGERVVESLVAQLIGKPRGLCRPRVFSTNPATFGSPGGW